MTNVLLDELIVPAPPYRMARPLATLAVSPSIGDQLKELSVPNIEAAPPIPEKTMHEKARERADAAERMRDSALEAKHPELRTKGEELSGIAASVREAAAAPTPEVGSETIYVRPPVPKSVSETRPVTTPKVLGSLEAERESLLAVKGTMSEQEFQRRMKEYDEAIAKRNAVPEAAPVPAQVPVGSRVGDVITEGKTKARVLEVNAEGRPTRLETIVEPQSEPVPIMQLTPQQQEALRVAGDEAKRAEKAAREMADKKAVQDAEKATRDAAARLAAQAAEKARLDAAAESRDKAAREAAEKAIQPEEEPQRESLREHIGPFDYVRGALDWAVEKSGSKPWLDTLAPRLESVFHRQMAEARMMQQVRAQGLLNRANRKLGNWEATAQDAGWPMRLFYASRVRAWQKHANTCEARVDKYESARHRWQEKHNDLQRQVSERYERELEPYRELTLALKSKEAAAMDVRKNLSVLRHDALKKLAVAKADAAKRSTFVMSSRTRRAIKEIEEEVKGLERLVAQADGSVAKARAPLARAVAGRDKWELKQKTVAQHMKFPEAAGLARPKRTTVGTPLQEGIAITDSQESAQAEDSVTQQRMAEQWQPADFVKRWNAYNVELAIENADEFTAFVTAERARLRQEGMPTRQQLLDITRQYQQPRVSPNAMKKFKASRELFAAKVNK